jgi:hypothetical protein
VSTALPGAAPAPPPGFAGHASPKLSCTFIARDRSRRFERLDGAVERQGRRQQWRDVDEAPADQFHRPAEFGVEAEAADIADPWRRWY